MQKVKTLAEFLTHGLWAFRLEERPRRHSLWIKPLRVFVLAIRGFIETRCMLRASALTFFTLLSIVPLLAVTFGVAKGFGFEKVLEEQIRTELSGQREVIDRAIIFAQAMLERTNGGIMAGLGIAFLFWAVIKVLSNIEEAFNEVWGVRKPRTMLRKLTDYLAFMVILPLLFLMAGTATVLVTSGMQQALRWMGAPDFLAGPIEALLKLFSVLIIWSLFLFMYIFLPNARVRPVAALMGAIIAGSAFHLTEWVYIRFQIGVGQINAIYGTFAALPLFLTWLQSSWLIVLFGAEVSFAWQNSRRYEYEHAIEAVSPRRRMAVAIGILRFCLRSFEAGDPPPGAEQIARSLRTSERMINQAVQDLVCAGLLLEVKSDAERGPAWVPARPTEQLTLRSAVSALARGEKGKEKKAHDPALARIEKKLTAWGAGEPMPADEPVKDL